MNHNSLLQRLISFFRKKKTSFPIAIHFILLFLFFLLLSPLPAEKTDRRNPAVEQDTKEKDPEEELKEIHEKMDLLLEELEVYRERARQWESLRSGLDIQERSILEERAASYSRREIIDERLKDEREKRFRLEREKDLLQGNLIYPGYGHFRQGRTIRGLSWAGLFLFSAVATVASHNEQQRIHRSLSRNTFNPVALPKIQARYDAASRNTLILGGITIGIYTAGIFDAALADPALLSNSENRRNSTAMRIAYDIRF